MRAENTPCGYVWVGLCAVWLAAGLVLAACDDDGDGAADVTPDAAADAGDDVAPDADAPATAAVTFTTFNAGLQAGFIPFVAERAPAVADAVAASDYDVLCLQEVWTPDHIDAVIDHASTPYTASYWVDTVEEPDQEPEPAACTEEEVAELLDCALENDCETDEAGLSTCVLTNCGAEFDALATANPDCVNCLAAHIDEPTIAGIRAACVEGGASAFTSQGRNGLILLSQHTFTLTEHIVFSSYLTRRAALHARADLPVLGPTDLFCAHLATPLPPVYDGEYESWEAEQRAQIEDLIDWIDTQATTGRVVLMGDFNTGPEIGSDIVGDLPENYALFPAEGFSDPYAEAASPECTMCPGNTLDTEDRERIVIDHVFLRGLPESLTLEVSRVFDELVDITVDGDTRQSNISDHFGVSVRATAPPPSGPPTP